MTTIFDNLKNKSKSQLEIFLTFYVIKENIAHTPKKIEEKVLDLMYKYNDEYIAEYELYPQKKERSKLGYNLAWARTFLKRNKLIINETRGRWTVTELGKNNEIDFMGDNLNLDRKKLLHDFEFMLEELEVYDLEGEQLVNLTFFDENIMDNKDLYFSLLIGKNSSGKSFLLNIINRLFVYLEKIKNSQYRTQSLKYSYFKLRYKFNNDTYLVIFNKQDSEENLSFYRNTKEVTIFDIDIPRKVIALSYNLNDKFLNREHESKMYEYKGCKKFTESFYLKSIDESLQEIISKNRYSDVKKILAFLGYTDEIKLSFEINNAKKLVNGKDNILSLNVFEANEEIRKRRQLTSIELKKLDEKNISIDNLSSGEKQILFTFLTLLARIEKNSLIMIEEPENSLHPSWQNKVIPLLTNVFGEKKYGIHILVATHSPYIVTDANPKQTSTIVCKKNINKLTYSPLGFSAFAWSIESILYEVFDMRTVRNFYVEQDLSVLIEYMNGSLKDRELLIRSLERLRPIVLNENDPLVKLIQKVESSLEREDNKK